MYSNVTLNYAFAMPGMGELVVIFLIVLVLFGAGKIPRIAKDLGSGIREFKKSIKDEKDDEGEKK
ncbi:MAG TPA: twin-arginine translocase TatA/TatE family subunit [Spirochaetota bacterium]|jgi:sec-independent protein translocase protein TatA|nr:MAG: Sec-independent protein translocase protein TatAy [Spirochaetes bacterium ADurb.Bin218]HOK03542.1 twin-arginine translocase TatA/TatE family subunit [Spirochaetota bacterium]HOK93849.1 twin-arginine translocase TatA/TatE family subunit [Spirochaetota bacterium]HON17300.1 twin-arginine translocase TatA/TatE family subunit [Spirochaetota bacterium]HPP96289.1 twin-arginine translocase TatA/TatE family subunit [Spirochaetota bacterium]